MRNLAIVLAAFAAGVGLAELLGAKNLGTALGVGQLTFAAALVYVLVRRPVGGGVRSSAREEGPGSAGSGARTSGTD